MILLTVFGIWSICQLLNFVYVDINGYEWSRIMMHNFYEEEDIDCLYLGSSHVFYGMNPEIMDELNDKNNFNLATSRQRMIGSYYMLLEALRHHEIETVYLEMFYAILLAENDEVAASWWCSDYMKNSAVRWNFVVDAVQQEQYLETFLPFVRYRGQLFDEEYIREQLEQKMTKEYREFSYSVECGGGTTVEYMPGGYYYSDIVLKESELTTRERIKFGDQQISEESLEYLEKIIQLCKEENIEIVLYSTPMYELKLLGLENYDRYIEQVNMIAEKYGIKYYDFNLVKGEHLSIQDRKYFHDLHHLNVDGAELFTRFFYEVMQRTPEENEEYFYSSYIEKMVGEEGKVYGLLYEKAEDTQFEKWKIASNWSEGMEYRIINSPSNGETTMVQDFSTEPYILIPIDGDGIYTIVSRRVDDIDSVSTMEIIY